MKIIKPLTIALLFPFGFGAAAIPAPVPIDLVPYANTLLAQDTLAWDRKLPFDDEVLRGTLENGFTYFIRKNQEPENRVTMFLAVKVGSILETEEELGLAHFLEHMNFNGLKHFPKNELVNYLQTAGVRFGSDLNAYTGFDQTVYQLPIPSDDPELLKNGLQVMRDWAQDALLETEEIDKERGVVLEEMRGARGANQRMQDQYLPVMLNGSRYANRLPIGTEEVITNFDPDVARAFHERWYRPDLQSIIIVGDIDPQEMEKEVIRLFSGMHVPENPVERTEYKVDLLDRNQFIAVTDPEMTATVVQIFVKHPEEKAQTVGDYRRSLLKSVYNQMVGSRLVELSQSANPPFLQASVGIGSFLAGLDNLSGFFVAKPGEVEEGLKALVRELERADQFGFNESEFQRAITNLHKSNETTYKERDKRRSDSYVNAYLNYFLEDAPALGNEDRYQITNQLLPTLTLKEVEAIAKEYYVDQNRDIVILGPEKDKDSFPDEATVNVWLTDVQAEELTAYEDNVSELPLLAEQPMAGTIVSAVEIPSIAAKELTLSNGMKVVLKPTTFKNDEILISGFARGGTSLYSDDDYHTATRTANLVNSSGLGQLNTTELKKYLTGKRANISPSIGEQTQGLSGSADKEGLQTAFEMIYGYFTAPRIEDDIFQSAIQRELSFMENRDNNPSFVFSKAVQESLYGDHIRRTPASVEDVKGVNKERALAIFKDRFADASGFTFTIVGSFTEEEIRPYLEQYLASLPALHRAEEGKDLGIVEPSRGFRKVVNKGKEDKVQVRLSYYGDYEYSELDNLNFDALESVLSIKLIERLREDESGVYGTGASASYSKLPRNRFSFHIGFGTSLEKYESLINSALDELRKVKKNGPTQEDLDKFKIEQRRQLEVNTKENTFWLSKIHRSLQNEEDLTAVTSYLDSLDQISVESVKAIAERYLQDERLFQFILLPELQE